MRSDESLADRHNPLSFGLFGPTCRLRVRRIVPHVERAVYAPIPRLVNGRRGATSPVLSPLLTAEEPTSPVLSPLSFRPFRWRKCNIWPAMPIQGQPGFTTEGRRRSREALSIVFRSSQERSLCRSFRKLPAVCRRTDVGVFLLIMPFVNANLATFRVRSASVENPSLQGKAIDDDLPGPLVGAPFAQNDRN